MNAITRTTLVAVLVALSLALGVRAAEPRVPGLRVRYFAGDDCTHLVAEDISRTLAVDPVFSKRAGEHPKSQKKVSVRFDGHLVVPEDGLYQFKLSTFGYGNLSIDGQQVLPLWATSHTVREHTASVNLKAGVRPITVRWRNHSLDERHMDWQWQGPSDKAYRPLDDALTVSTWEGMPPHLAESLSPDATRVPGVRADFYAGIDFAKHLDTKLLADVNLLMPFKDDDRGAFSARFSGVFMAEKEQEHELDLKVTDGGVRLWLGDRLVVDEWRSGKKDVSKPVVLAAGPNPFRCEYFQGGGNRSLRLRFNVRKGTESPGVFMVLPTEELTAAKPFIVFIFVGHSVMRGDGRQTVKDIDVDIWDFDAATGRGPWRRFASEGDNVGPAKPFLQELAKAYPDYRFGAIRVVGNGTGAASYQKDTELFARIVQCVKSVRSSAQIAGVATCLGWMESHDEKKAQEFLPNYLRFIADLRQALGTPDLPILASHIEGAWEGTREDKGSWSMINKAYKTLPDQVKHLQVIPVDGIPTYDTHHFTTEGDAIWGQRAMKTAQALDAVGRARKLWDQRPIAASAFVPQTRPDEATDEKAPVAAVVRAKLIRHSRSRSLEQLGPYTHLLVVSEYRIVEVKEGRLDERDIIVIQHSVSDRKPTLAMTAKVGETHLLTLVPWASQRKLHGLAMDDDLVEIERDRYYARRSRP